MLGKVLVVEDDDFTRLSLCASLQLQGAEPLPAQNAAEALAIAAGKVISAALIDLHLGSGPNGIDLALELRRKDRSIGLVFLSSFASPRLLIPKANLPTGSVYLVKRQIKDGDSILRALNQSLSGKWVNRPQTVALAGLSESQLETLKLVAQGHSNKEIARRRFVTERSVEKAISRIAKQLGLESAPEQNQRVQLTKAYLREIGANGVDI